MRGLTQPKVLDIRKIILFICTGNSCRSVIAAALFRKMLKEAAEGERSKEDVLSRIEVLSAGVASLPGMQPPPGTLRVMQEEGIDVSDHRAASVKSELLRESSLILVMEERHEKEILDIVPECVGKIFLLKKFAEGSKQDALDIPDPIGRTLDVYRKCTSAIKVSLEGLLERILSGKVKL